MDPRCIKPNCQCTHSNGCIKGYIFVRYKDVKTVTRNNKKETIEKWYEGVRFCPTCDPVRAHIQDSSRTSEEMAERLRNRSSLKHAENYEKEETSKTRTL